MESNGHTNCKQSHSNGKGGRISSLLILGTCLGLGVAAGPWLANLLIFLVNEFNVKNIAAAKITNIFIGFSQFSPFIASIAADSAFGPFYVILLSSIVSFVGVAILTVIVSVKSLRPPPCSTPNSPICVAPSTFQLSILYIAMALASLGAGGSRFLLGPMGADQFVKPKHQASFLTWFVIILSLAWIISFTILIYIEDSVSWVLAYGIALVANVIGVVLFVAGSRIYRKLPSEGSPFTSIARVFVSAIRKIKVKVPVDGEEDCYLYETSESKISYGGPSKSLRFFNRAAVINRSNPLESTTKTKSWSLCTVEEVEDLKKLIKLVPLWSSGIFLSTPIGVATSLSLLMALVMDRSIGSHLEIPVAAFVAVSYIFNTITISALHLFIRPLYKKITTRNLTHLQGIGISHCCNMLAIIALALIERKRLDLVQAHNLTSQPNSIAPMSALWLFFPLAIIGIGEGSYFPAEVAMFYQEFPSKLRSTSIAIVLLHIAAGFYLSSAFIELVGRLTSWLPNDINHGRVDMTCWLLLVVVGLDFGYFLLCAMLYEYNNPDPELDDEAPGLFVAS